jgi:gamma-glutamyltranspeptidase/glutathione hydrolase
VVKPITVERLQLPLPSFRKPMGGRILRADFAAYQPEWVTPIAKNYRGYTLHEIPPNGQGIAALIALGILSHFDLSALPPDGVDAQHLQIEAMKLAFADTYRYVSESAAMTMPVEHMLDDAYLASRARLIQMNRAQDFKAGNPVKGGTIYLSAADENGMMVSFIQSNYMGFGSGCVEPTFGISLQKPRSRFWAGCRARCIESGQRSGPWQTAFPHHHSGFPEQGRSTCDELWCDGRQHAATGPYADPGAHAGLPAKPAGRL